MILKSQEHVLKTVPLPFQKRKSAAKPGGPKAKSKKSVSPMSAEGKRPASLKLLHPQDTEEEEEEDEDEDEPEKASSEADSSSDDDDDDDDDDVSCFCGRATLGTDGRWAVLQVNILCLRRRRKMMTTTTMKTRLKTKRTSQRTAAANQIHRSRQTLTRTEGT